MADSSVVLNPGVGGDAIDAESVGSNKRERVQVAGAALAEIARVLNADPAASDYGLVVRPLEPTYPSYYAVFDRIVPAANKYMATLFNTSATRKVRIRRVWRFNWQITVVTGVLLEQYLARITARTAGTAVTIQADDTADTLSAGISADTNSSAVTEDHIVKRLFATSEEFVVGDVYVVENILALDPTQQLIYAPMLGGRGITLRQNQGITIRNVTSSTVGNVSYCIEFTDEAA
jgi:hypothetical protein